MKFDKPTQQSHFSTSQVQRQRLKNQLQKNGGVYHD